jgi:hypothetical protein
VSVMFSVDGTSIWWPANTVGRLFKLQADAIAAALEISSGLGEMSADEVVIDLPVFEEFIVKLSDQYATPYYVAQSLITGVFGTSYVIVQRAGGQLPEIDAQRAPGWEEMVFQFSRSMPR